jgi:hypothetical protein
LHPGAGAEIMNCGSSFGSGSGSFLFTTDLKKKKTLWLKIEEVFVNFYNFYLLKLYGAGVEAAIRKFGSTEPEEVFPAPKHWLKVSKYTKSRERPQYARFCSTAKTTSH